MPLLSDSAAETTSQQRWDARRPVLRTPSAEHTALRFSLSGFLNNNNDKSSRPRRGDHRTTVESDSMWSCGGVLRRRASNESSGRLGASGRTVPMTAISPMPPPAGGSSEGNRRARDRTRLGSDESGEGGTQQSRQRAHPADDEEDPRGHDPCAKISESSSSPGVWAEEAVVEEETEL